MADTLTSQRRSQLIREMAADLKRTRMPPPPSPSRSSDADNTHTSIELTNTQSNFEGSGPIPTIEQDNDFSQPIPHLRPRALSPNDIVQSQQNFQINSSSMNRAFQSTSQNGSRNGSRNGSQTGSDHSISIEQGRGFPSGAQSQSCENSFGYDNSMDFSAAVLPNYNLASSPPTRPTAPISRKENISASRLSARTRRIPSTQAQCEDIQLPSTAKDLDFGSAESRQTSTEGRNVLGAAHAPVLEEEGATELSEDRPSTVNTTIRNTRFVGSKAGKPKELTPFPRHFSASNDLLRKLSHSSTTNRTRNQQPSLTTMATDATAKAKSHQPSVATTATDATPNGGGSQGIQQSFVIPDMPNITELISGTFTDGTPVFSRTGRSRTTSSRFSNAGRKSRLGHVKVSSIPVPEEEEAIYMSLKLLQDKVADLENEKVEADAVIQELEEKNYTLEEKNGTLEMEAIQRQKSRRSDSGLGTTSGSDAGDENGCGRSGYGSRKTLIEKTRLENTVQKLREQLNSANTKASIAEAAIKNLTKERDSAISQLGIAFVTTEQLKIENEQLIDEIEQLRLEAAQLKGEESKKSHESETVSARLRSTTGSPDITEVLSVDAAEEKPEASRTTRSKQALPTRVARFPEERQPKSMSRKALEESSVSTTNDLRSERPNSIKPHDKPDVKIAHRGADNFATEEDLTMLSYPQEFRFANIRRSLEQEKTARRGHHDNDKAYNVGAGDQMDESVASKPALARKSSLKAPAKATVDKSTHGRTSARVQQDVGPAPKTKSTAQSRRKTEEPLPEQQNRNRRISTEDMTSAFILPDITMRNPSEATMKLSNEAQNVFDRLASHEGENCTICKHVIDRNTPHEHGNGRKIAIPKPVPVSERMPSPGPDDEDVTMRPSQPPPIALATVMKSLEDELEHLKIELDRYQALYNKHDPSLSKRKRKMVYDKIEKVLKTIDAKADQIYALYDVLEGQKETGKEMTEGEVEMTLQSVGIDVEAALFTHGEHY